MARRKVKKGVFKKLFLFIVIVAIGIGGYFTYDHYFKNNKNENNSIIPKPSKKPEEPKDEVYNLNFLATGDGLIHSVVYRTYRDGNGGFDFSGALTEVKDIVSKYDIAYYNQETPFGGKGTIPCNLDSTGYCGYPRFNTPSEYGDAMIALGFNTISLASNHAWDSGKQGVLNTIKYFKTTDTLYDGMNESTERSQYIIKEKNNITYTMLSYTTLDNGLSNANNRYLVNMYNKETVKKDIEAVRDKVDVLIVAMHWGVEYQSNPNNEQKEIAEYLASLGVDIVVGNHPHVLQPITKINDTVVMYSLGNFISNQYGSDDWNKLVGFLATLDITKTVHPNGEVEMKFDNLGGELIFTKYDGHPTATSGHKNHRVIPFSKMSEGFLLNDTTKASDYKRVYEKYTRVLKSMGTDLNITPLKNA